MEPIKSYSTKKFPVNQQRAESLGELNVAFLTFILPADRKFGELALSCRKKLKDNDLSVIHDELRNVNITVGDNLCPYDVRMLGMCRHLWSKKKIDSCWSWKGGIFIKVGENDRPKKIDQMSDLYSLFKDFEFF